MDYGHRYKMLQLTLKLKELESAIYWFMTQVVKGINLTGEKQNYVRVIIKFILTTSRMIMEIIMRLMIVTIILAATTKPNKEDNNNPKKKKNNYNNTNMLIMVT